MVNKERQKRIGLLWRNKKKKTQRWVSHLKEENLEELIEVFHMVVQLRRNYEQNSNSLAQVLMIMKQVMQLLLMLLKIYKIRVEQ